MNNTIYAVMYSYYSDWEIYGYFTSREDADKYCVAHAEQDLYVKEIECYDDINEHFRNISLKYTYDFTFRNIEGDYILDESAFEYDPKYECYQDEFLHSNQITSYSPESVKNWIRFYVNVGEPNYEKAKKIALDLFYQYMDFCNKKPSWKSINEFNIILSKEERDREEVKKQEKIRKEELAELARLKEKYEHE